MKIKLKKITIGFSIFFLVGIVGVIFIAPYGILQPPRTTEDLKPQKFDLESEELNIKVEANVSLKGYIISQKGTTSKGVIILVHGIGGCKEHFLGLSKKLAERGISSFLFDGRAHGKSGGKYCTYGFYEKKDISKIVDLIKNKTPNLPIGIWGNSLGGAIAIQAMEYDNRISFGVIESTFTELSQIVFDYKKRILKGFGIKWLSDIVLKRAGSIANFSPKNIQPIKSVKNIEQPIFLAHGDSDENILPKYGQQLFENLKSKRKEFHLIKDAGHFDLFEKGGKDYENNILKFIESNLK